MVRQPDFSQFGAEDSAPAQSFSPEDAEMEVEKMYDEGAPLESNVKMNFDGIHIGKSKGGSNGHGERQGIHSNGNLQYEDSSANPPSSTASPFEFSFPSTQTTPKRSFRRQAPPSSIPNFPSSHEPRNPPSATPFSPSPTHSPAASSPFRSPEAPIHGNTASTRAQGFNLPISQPAATPFGGGGMNSPWLSLAASSGAPTPSLESGPMGRGSPHLGYPFERLNIGGSWSGANLWGEGAQGRRDSQDSTGVLSSSPNRDSLQLSSPPPMSLPPPPARGLSFETLQRYKAMASGPSNLPPVVSNSSSAGQADQASKPSSQDFGALQLPAALAKRRGSLPKANVGQTLSLPPSRAGKSPSPLASSSTTSSPGAGNAKRLQPISPQALLTLLSSPTTLILDVRPPSSFQASHLPHSHSVAVPSTLLRRAAFTLQKLAQMLSPSSLSAVNAWREKGDIILLDADSSSAADGSIMDGLALKFDREGYTGHLWFVKGGHSAVKQHGTIPLMSEDDHGDDKADAWNPKSGPNASANKGLMAGRLGSFAFQQESTGSGRKGRAPPPTGLSIPPTPGFSLKSNPFGISMPGSMASSSTERPRNGNGDRTAGMIDDARPAKIQPANPFFDNIRQNLELSHGGITERIPLKLPDSVTNRVHELPEFLRDLVTMPEQDSMDTLAKQFYNLELSEQKRLQSVMEWHSKDSAAASNGQAGKEDWTRKRQNDAIELKRLVERKGQTATGQDDYYPFSITAGVERGTKNRYKNIWPYDFSRVRLVQPPDQDSDYINASFIQPRGTARRYIATQGPLDATYHDFWTLVWEQDVHVIVMITKQFEGGLMKCGNYWGDKDFGSLHLTLLQQTGGEDHAPQPTTGFDFGPAAVTPSSSSFPTGNEKNIRRVFKLSNDAYPEEPPRTITQIQCIGWPDFDVPETPEILGNLIKEVDQAVDESESTSKSDQSEQPPVLVHCSAGVGRTGSFIVVDAILDGLRRELRERRGSYGSSAASFRKMQGSTSSSVFNHSQAGQGKSGDSGKGVSFLSPPTEFNFSFPTSSASPEPRTIFSSSPGAISPQDAGRQLTAENLAESTAQTLGEKMDVDQPAASEQHNGEEVSPLDHRFFQHRGSITNTVSSDAGLETRRPSLVSTRLSSEMLLAEAKSTGQPATGFKLELRHRSPSPISEMTDPVPSVLEGMRVQRMSLVQSLRQYLFVHRAIITNYLHMVDEEKEGGNSAGVKAPPLTTNTSASTTSTINTTDGSVDDEGHVKRRASPSDLELETDRIQAVAARGGGIAGGSTSGLSKRPSFKKMRQAVDVMAPSGSESSSGSLSGSGPSGSGGVPTSPKPKSRLRSRSKLALSSGKGTDEGATLPLPTPAGVPLPLSSPSPLGGIELGSSRNHEESEKGAGE